MVSGSETTAAVVRTGDSRVWKTIKARNLRSGDRFVWDTYQKRIFIEFIKANGLNYKNCDKLEPLLVQLNLQGYDNIKNDVGISVHEIIEVKVRRKLDVTAKEMGEKMLAEATYGPAKPASAVNETGIPSTTYDKAAYEPYSAPNPIDGAGQQAPRPMKPEPSPRERSHGIIRPQSTVRVSTARVPAQNRFDGKPALPTRNKHPYLKMPTDHRALVNALSENSQGTGNWSTQAVVPTSYMDSDRYPSAPTLSPKSSEILDHLERERMIRSPPSSFYGFDSPAGSTRTTRSTYKQRAFHNSRNEPQGQHSSAKNARRSNRSVISRIASFKAELEDELTGEGSDEEYCGRNDILHDLIDNVEDAMHQLSNLHLS